MKLRELIPHGWRQELKRKLFNTQDMRARLQNLSRAGFVPTGAIDGGAYHGDWSRDLWSVWPKCPVLLVEPQPDCVPALDQLAKRVKGSVVASMALSSDIGHTRFHLSQSGSAICDSAEGSILVEKTTIRQLLEQHRTFRPNLIKLDLQGHEIEALKGAGELGFLELIILEVSVLRIGEVPIFTEIDQYLESHGFRLYDLIPQWYRPLDGALWQIDAFYVNHNSPLIGSRDWGEGCG